MSTQHQRRPGDRIPQAPERAGAERGNAARDEHAQEQLQSGAELDAEAASHLAGQMGNAAFAAALAARDRSGQGAEEEEEQAEEEAGLDEDAAQEKGADAALPSFGGSGGTGATGGPGGPSHAPWEVGRAFGGDDDGAGAPAPRARWEPASLPPDPDDDEIDDIDALDPDDEEVAPVDPAVTEALREAETALGTLPWAPGALGRAMRACARLVRPRLEPETLADMGPAEHALPRLRRGLAHVARHGTGPDARTRAAAARAAAEATLAPRGGLAGATARMAALAEAALEDAPACEANLFDIAADTRARPWAEQAAVAVAREGRLAADGIFAKAWGALGDPAVPALPRPDGPTAEGLRHAARQALEAAGEVRPYPELDRYLPSTPQDEPDASHDALAAVDALLAAHTADTDAPDPRDALFDGINRVLSALGRTQVELAAMCLACAAHLPPGALHALLVDADARLLEAARALADAGQALEEADADDAFAPLLASTAVREAAGVGADTRARTRDALLDALLAEAPPRLRETPAPGAMRALLEVLERAHDPTRTLARAAGLPGADGRVARILAGGWALARDVDAAAREAAAAEDLADFVDAGRPWAVVDAAARLAHATHDEEDWSEALRVAGRWLRASGQSAPLQLLKAVWAEEALRRTHGR
ncbi:MAG: hypothetical protein RLZZ299_586 [Pseudomonadota bacterium]|jgi:hypothetical protein